MSLWDREDPAGWKQAWAKASLWLHPNLPQVDKKSPARGLEQMGRAPDPCPAHHLSRQSARLPGQPLLPAHHLHGLPGPPPGSARALRRRQGRSQSPDLAAPLSQPPGREQREPRQDRGTSRTAASGLGVAEGGSHLAGELLPTKPQPAALTQLSTGHTATPPWWAAPQGCCQHLCPPRIPRA